MGIEESEQRVVVQWLRFKKIRHFHPPNGGLRDKVTASKMKGLGVVPGVPDLLVLTPPPRWTHYRPPGCAIEMKSPRGRLTPEQKSWLEYLKSTGWHTCVARSADEAIKFLEGLGY